mmetsp:Transcript_1781/g.4890  ORF Transcript_1781/g.4890 Transcript_1781/m.4890 type:complete len:441 (-) Transcript_1781:51-1373(-)
MQQVEMPSNCYEDDLGASIAESHDIDIHGGGGLQSVPSAVFLLCCLALGVGVFAIPCVFNSVGSITGVIMIFGFGFISTMLMIFSLDVLVEHESWDSLVATLPLGKLASRVSLFAALMTANSAHFSFITGMLFDLMTYFVTGQFGQYALTRTKQLLLIIVFLVAAYPFTLHDDMGALRHIGKMISGVVITSCFMVVLFSLIRVAEGDGASGSGVSPSDPVVPVVSNVFRSMATIAFAFTSMSSFPEVVRAMKKGRPHDYRVKMRAAVFWAGGIIFTIYLLVSIVAVWAFGTEAGSVTTGSGKGNVLYNFPKDNYLITILSFLLVVVIVLDYPVILFPATNIVLSVTKTWDYPHARALINIFLGVIVLLVVIVVPDLGDVFGLCGALGVSVFCYVLPGSVVARYHHAFGAKLLGFLSIVLGLTMLILSTYYIIKNIVSPSK